MEMISRALRSILWTLLIIVLPHNLLIGQESNSTVTQDSLLVEIGRYDQGVSYDFEVVGNHAFVGAGKFLKILDISDPSNISELANVEITNTILSVAADSSIVAVGQLPGLSLIDISNIQTPRLVTTISTGTDIRSLTIEDTLLIAATNSSLRTYSLAVSDSLSLLQNWSAGFTSEDMVVEDTSIFIASRNGLKIISIADPMDINLVSSVSSLGRSEGIAKQNNNVYLATESNGFIIFDVTNPNLPIETSRIDSLTFWEGVASSGNYVYATTYFPGAPRRPLPSYVIDVSDPFAPQITNQFALENERIFSMQINNNRLFLLDFEDGLQVFNLQDPADPTYEGKEDTYGWALDMQISGDQMFIANSLDQLQILEISNPNLVQELGTVSSNDGWSVAEGNGVAFVGGITSNKIKAYDISTPGAIVELGEFQTGSRVADIVISNETGYLANGEDGLRILDVSNPAQLSELGSLGGFSYAYTLAYENNIVYLFDRNQGVFMIDVSIPNQPQILSSHLIGNSSGASFAFKAPYLYLGGGDHRFSMVDVSNPSSPFLINSEGGGQPSAGIAVSENYAYMLNSGNDDILRVYDVSNPFSPVQIDNINLGNNFPRSIAAAHDMVAVSTHRFQDGRSTIFFYQNPALTAIGADNRNHLNHFQLEQNYPNPFNPATTIEYSLQIGTNVVIVILDLLGRPIRTLISEKQPVGSYEVEWDGRNDFGKAVSSGVYLYRLKTGLTSETRKMLLIR